MDLPFNYIGVFIFSILVILCTVLLHRKIFAPYKGLPGYSQLRIFKLFLLLKIPKGHTATSFLFQTLVTLAKEYTSEGLSFFWLFQPYVLVFGGEPFKLFSKEEAAVNKSNNYHIIEECMGFGLITNNGDSWRKKRKILNPVFNAAMLKDKVPLINKNANILIKEVMEAPKDCIEIHKHLKICAFANIYEFTMGLDVTERKTEIKKIIHLVEMVSNKIIERSVHPVLFYKYVQYLLPSGRQYFENIRLGREAIGKIVKEVKESNLLQQNSKEVDETDEYCSVAHRSFAQILVEHHFKDESFTFEYMTDELTTFLTAGYDTAAYAMMYCLFLLGHNQEIQDLVYNELESELENNYVSIDDIQKLTYLEAVIKESLRLYPPVPIFSRCLDKDVQCGKYNVPKGTSVVFSPYLYHRDPNVFPEPDKFYPERFLNADSENRPLSMIFAEGARTCIGKKFALLELKIVLAHFLRSFKVVSLTKPEDIILNWSIVLCTVDPVYVRLIPRQKDIPFQEEQSVREIL